MVAAWDTTIRPSGNTRGGRIGEILARRAEIEAEMAALNAELEVCRKLTGGFDAVSVDTSVEARGGGSLRRELALLLLDEARSIRDIPGLLAARFGRTVAKEDVWPVLSRMKAEGALRSVGRGVWAMRRRREADGDLFGGAAGA